ncbi:MAG: DUF4105 domain-containing protein [Bacillota bacterium]
MRLIVGLLIVLSGFSAFAQQVRPTTQTSEPGSELTVYLVTIGPGSEIYERFAHNAIWIHDRGRGTDVAYNYGVFDMGESGFILRFLQGRMWYWLEEWDARQMIDMYRDRFDRSVMVQRLNLTPEQRLKLRGFLAWNARPENSHYRYDYYTDNCSTRVRDALDRVLGGQLQQQLKAIQTKATYRDYTRRAMEYDPIMYTALYFILGQPVDRPLSAWQECFLPTELQRYVRDVKVVNAAGQQVPLVDSEMTLHAGSQPPVPEEPPRWTGYYLLVGVVIGGVITGLGWLAPMWRMARRMLAVVSGLWLFVIGVMGTFSAGVWLFTSHVAAYRNENLLQFSPVALPLAVVVPALVFGAGWARRWSKVTLYGMAFVAGSSVLGLLLKVLPWFGQVNGEMIALVLPVYLALVGVVYWIGGSRGEVREAGRTGKKRSKKKGGQGTGVRGRDAEGRRGE